MIYLDTGVLVRGLLTVHPHHSECELLINAQAVSSCHSLAETFNTLTGFFQVPNDLASEMVESLSAEMCFEVVSQRDYLQVIREARKRGIQGGIVYDALHAEIARRLKLEKIISYNLSNFRHVAPDIPVELP
ncbi:MAG TPA: PIN domain-containing protein [Verrucomicrobiae bacterium]|nr:PIN domain-containing protein [Verrucomicrobiae bacterium]